MVRTLLTACGVFALAAAADYVQMHSAPASPALAMQRQSVLAPFAVVNQTARETTVIVTGCLKPWDDMAGAPAPSSATTAASGGRRFLLVNVESEPPGESDRIVRPPVQYVVTADASVDLGAHVNHKVRITGRTSAAPAATGAGRPPEPPPPGTPPPDPARPETPMPDARPAPTKGWALLTATSIAMVSTSCPTTAN
jgi:hypothetical protein